MNDRDHLDVCASLGIWRAACYLFGVARPKLLEIELTAGHWPLIRISMATGWWLEVHSSRFVHYHAPDRKLPTAKNVRGITEWAVEL